MDKTAYRSCRDLHPSNGDGEYSTDLNCQETIPLLIDGGKKKRKFTYQPKIMIFDNEQNTNVALECKEFIKYLTIIPRAQMGY